MISGGKTRVKKNDGKTNMKGGTGSRSTASTSGIVIDFASSSSSPKALALSSSRSQKEGSTSPSEAHSRYSQIFMEMFQASSNEQLSEKLVNFVMGYQKVTKGQCLMPFNMYMYLATLEAQPLLRNWVTQGRFYEALASLTIVWSLLFKSCVAEKPLIKNSVNCMFTIQSVQYWDGEETKVFAKFVDFPKKRGVDDILIDISNALIMTSIGNINPKIRENMLQYFYSCVTYTHQEGHDIMWSLQHMTTSINASNPLHISDTNVQQRTYTPKYVALFNAIDGMAVSSMLKTKDPLQLQAIVDATADFWDTYMYLGLNYGMVHHDLHAGNVMYNPTTKSLVMIDYGRMEFVYFLFPVSIDTSLSDAFVFECQKNGRFNMYNYSDIHSMIRAKAPINVVNGKYCMFLYDLIFFYIRFFDYCWEFYTEEQLKVAFNIDNHIINIKQNPSTGAYILTLTTTDYNKIYQWFEKSKINPGHTKSTLRIIEAMFYIALISLDCSLAGKSIDLDKFRRVISVEGFALTHHLVDFLVQHNINCFFMQKLNEIRQYGGASPKMQKTPSMKPHFPVHSSVDELYKNMIIDRYVVDRNDTPREKLSVRRPTFAAPKKVAVSVAAQAAGSCTKNKSKRSNKAQC